MGKNNKSGILLRHSHPQVQSQQDFVTNQQLMQSWIDGPNYHVNENEINNECQIYSSSVLISESQKIRDWNKLNEYSFGMNCGFIVVWRKKVLIALNVFNLIQPEVNFLFSLLLSFCSNYLHNLKI